MINTALFFVGLGLFILALRVLKIGSLPSWRLIAGLVILSLSGRAIGLALAAAKAWALAVLA